MDEIKDLLEDILKELKDINTRLDKIDGSVSLDDIYDKIDDVSSTLIVHSGDTSSKLEDIQGGFANNSIHEVCQILEDIEANTSNG